MTDIAFYARYSCDQQRETSIEDQIRRCREVATRRGIDVKNALIFVDDALSGTFKHEHLRQGYRDLLEAWDANRFTLVVVDEFTRLTRDGIEQARIIRRLEDNRRVRLITADGIDTSLPGWQMLVSVQGMCGQQTIRTLKHLVPRGMIGQLERGFMIATPAFGYEFKREIDAFGNRVGTHWTVNDTEAAIVREVFARREAGQSMHQIARWLNDSGVPCSRKAKVSDGGYWRPSRVRGLLANPIYRGEFVWHGSTTHKASAEKRGEPVEPKPYARPALRLVSDETWHRCNRKAISRSGYGGGKHVLAGLVTCGCCTGTLVLSSDDRCRSLYCANCTTAKSSKGDTHRMSVTVAAVGVRQLLTEALKHFLTDEFVEVFRASLRERLTGDRTRELEACKAELAGLRRAQVRLSHMLATTDGDDSVLPERYRETCDSMRDAQARLDLLLAGQAQVDTATIEQQLRTDPATLLDGLFEADVAPEHLRALLSRLFPSIVLEGKDGRYRSYFRIQFVPGAALAMASGTTTVDKQAVALRFELRYRPDNRSEKGAQWSVTRLPEPPMAFVRTSAVALVPEPTQYGAAIPA